MSWHLIKEINLIITLNRRWCLSKCPNPSSTLILNYWKKELLFIFPSSSKESKKKKKKEKSLTYVTSGVWSQQSFSCKDQFYLWAAVQSRWTSKNGPGEKKANGQLLDLFPNEKTNPDQWGLIGMCRVEESLISFYTKSPVVITHRSWTSYHGSSGGSDVFPF